MVNVPFPLWVERQQLRDDPIGDVARDACLDPDWPEEGTLSDLRRIVGSDLHWILDEAWEEYLALEREGKLPKRPR